MEAKSQFNACKIEEDMMPAASMIEKWSRYATSEAHCVVRAKQHALAGYKIEGFRRINPDTRSSTLARRLSLNRSSLLCVMLRLNARTANCRCH